MGRPHRRQRDRKGRPLQRRDPSRRPAPDDHPAEPDPARHDRARRQVGDDEPRRVLARRRPSGGLRPDSLRAQQERARESLPRRQAHPAHVPAPGGRAASRGTGTANGKVLPPGAYTLEVGARRRRRQQHAGRRAAARFACRSASSSSRASASSCAAGERFSIGVSTDATRYTWKLGRRKSLRHRAGAASEGFDRCAGGTRSRSPSTAMSIAQRCSSSERARAARRAGRVHRPRDPARRARIARPHRRSRLRRARHRARRDRGRAEPADPRARRRVRRARSRRRARRALPRGAVALPAAGARVRAAARSACTSAARARSSSCRSTSSSSARRSSSRGSSSRATAACGSSASRRGRSPAFIGWTGVSLAWSKDVNEGAIQLLAFYIPFALLALTIARLPWSRLGLRVLYARAHGDGARVRGRSASTSTRRGTSSRTRR